VSLSWTDRAACLGLEDAFLLGDGRGSDNRGAAQEAVRLCASCPVLPQCRAWSEGYSWTSVVVGGRWFGAPSGKTTGRHRPSIPDPLAEAV
jgi:hypothetical protein